MFGLLRCMNGSEGLCVRNAPCLTTVVARLFWRILGGGLVCSTSVGEGKSLRDRCTV